MSLQAVAHFTNRKALVIGEITDAEAREASLIDESIDGKGVYLLSVDRENPMSIAGVLAKFVSEEAAAELAQFFRLRGALEA
jgi:hypothetical protein